MPEITHPQRGKGPTWHTNGAHVTHVLAEDGREEGKRQPKGERGEQRKEQRCNARFRTSFNLRQIWVGVGQH
eukprot:15464425-Alexandrium_andersonii.AAC.1